MNNLSHSDQLLVWRKRRERALGLHEAGLTLGEIAEQLKITRQRVHQLITRAQAQSSEMAHAAPETEVMG